MDYHRSLKRQIRKVIGMDSELLQDPSIHQFLDVINENYIRNDYDRNLLDRSLQLTSKELNERYRELELRLEQKEQSHSQLEQLLSIIDSTLEASLDGIVLVDRQGISRMFNQRAADLLCTTKDYIRDGNPAKMRELVERVASNPEDFVGQLDLLSQNPMASTCCTLEMHNGLIVEIHSQARIHNGKVAGRVWNLHDITELRKNQQVIHHRAYHDVLTDLPNRILFQERIEKALSRYDKSKGRIALFFIDLDGFKLVNDTLGHELGDKILIQVANRLRQVIGKHDVLARHGGDEFLLMLENVKEIEHTITVAKAILSNLSDVFHLDDRDIYISASIGITMAPKDGTKPEELIRKADMAMYHAKAQGKNNFEFFKESIADDSMRHLLLKSELNQAIQKKEFVLFYQPKFNLKTGKICGAEALIRWQKSDGRIAAPGEFIEVAEQSGLIIPISEWVFHQACEQLAQWLPNLDDDFVLSVNLSAKHFRKSKLVEFVLAALVHYQIPFHRFELEITESVVMENPENSIAKLSTLRNMGINLSIDDFGTGYSSFNYLKDLPINIIKIDRSFVMNIEESSKDLSLVESIVNIAHILDLKVVAEGIESAKSGDLLRDVQCDYAQGYHYDKPLPADDFAKYLNEQ